MRETVRFAAAVEAVLGTGIETFVEISPQPVLSSVLLTFDAAGKAPQVVASLRRGRGDASNVEVGRDRALGGPLRGGRRSEEQDERSE